MTDRLEDHFEDWMRSGAKDPVFSPPTEEPADPSVVWQLGLGEHTCPVLGTGESVLPSSIPSPTRTTRSNPSPTSPRPTRSNPNPPSRNRRRPGKAWGGENFLAERDMPEEGGQLLPGGHPLARHPMATLHQLSLTLTITICPCE